MDAKQSRRKNQKSDIADGVHEPGHCTWYGQCYQTDNIWYNCLAKGNKRAKKMEDDEGLKVLKEICPALYGDGQNVRTCCSTDQLLYMQSSMQVPFTVRKKSVYLVEMRKIGFFGRS